MITIQRGNDISILWTIKNISGEAVDFSGCDITFAVRSKLKGAFFVIPTSTDAGVIRANVPGNVLPVGHFYLDVEWNKIISGRKVYWRARTEELIEVTNKAEDFKQTVSVTADTAIITQGYVPDESTFINKNELAQTTGDNTTIPMSQAATTEKLTELDSTTSINQDLIRKEVSLLPWNKQNILLYQGLPNYSSGVIELSTKWACSPMIPGFVIECVAVDPDYAMNSYAYRLDGTYEGMKAENQTRLAGFDKSLQYIIAVRRADKAELEAGVNDYLNIKFTNNYGPQWLENLSICDRSKKPVVEDCSIWANRIGELVDFEKSKYGPSNDKGFLLEENDANYSILFPCKRGETYIISTNMGVNRNTALYLVGRPEETRVPFFFLHNRYNSDISIKTNHPTAITAPDDGYILYLYQREYIAGIDDISIKVHTAVRKPINIITQTDFVKSRLGFNPDDLDPDLRSNIYERENYRSIIVKITRPCTICIKKSAVTDIDRACTTSDYPSNEAKIKSVLTNISNGGKTEIYFTINSECYLVYQYSNTSQEIDITVDCNPLLDVTMPKNRGINENWDKWSDVRYNYGFDKTKQPIFNTIEGVCETDTMFSCRGGKGRWNPTDNPTTQIKYGGHVFEGWNKDENFRLTMLIGKYTQSFACIQTYSPAGLSEEQRRFGWVKIGCDETGTGFDFGRKWGVAYGPLSLYQYWDEINEVYDADLHPTFKNNPSKVPDGTIYYDTVSQHVKCKTNAGWKTIKFIEDE